MNLNRMPFFFQEGITAVFNIWTGPDNGLVSANSRSVNFFSVDGEEPAGRLITCVFSRNFGWELIIETGQALKDSASAVSSQPYNWGIALMTRSFISFYFLRPAVPRVPVLKA